MKTTVNSFSVLKHSTLWLTSLLFFSFSWPNSPLLATEVKQTSGGRSTQSAAVPSSFEDYRKQCMQQARGQGLSGDIAEDLCNCTIAKFQSQYNFSQFRALVVKSQNDRNAARTLTEVGETCFDQILYE
ncbi:hypothetical protein [Gloeothece citriformis]|nr:hypothetical protein [Gloeothece citriformis]